MKIFSASQIKEWDQATVSAQSITSVDLMERAAKACADKLFGLYPDEHFTAKIFCGKGNNGGDGLAIARLIQIYYKHACIYILENGKAGSADFQQNLTRLHQVSTDVHFIQAGIPLPEFGEKEIIIDAIFGTGLNDDVTGLAAELIVHINNSNCPVVSVDLPSGMFPDKSSKGSVVIKARHTLTFQNYKIALLLDENAPFFGDVHVLDINLDKAYYHQTTSSFEIAEPDLIKNIYKPRSQFSHKGNYGHVLLIAGSYGMIGAAVLSAKGCLRSGVGKLDCQLPACGYEIMQHSVPEAMTVVNGIQNLNSFIPNKKYNAIGVGPGIGRYSENGRLLSALFEAYNKPVVIDADALYALATEPERLNSVPEGSVLTPHGYEFERLFGKTTDDFQRLNLLREKAFTHNCYICLKGHHTAIATPQGNVHFNSTGNAGMATGGSGDVLTGIITGLIAQGYTPLHAAILGIYLHGRAGDLAAEDLSMESMVAGDIVKYLGKAFLEMKKEK